MGGTHPSKLLMSQEEVGNCRFLFRSGNVWCKSRKLLPGQGVPVLPLISLSGGVSITTSFPLKSSYFSSIGVTLKTPYASFKISLCSFILMLIKYTTNHALLILLMNRPISIPAGAASAKARPAPISRPIIARRPIQRKAKRTGSSFTTLPLASMHSSTEVVDGPLP